MISSEKDRPVATVGALLVAPDQTILLVRTHKWQNRLGLPGGKIEHGETLELALCREILEETGLKIANSRFICIQESINSPEFYKAAHLLLINFVAEVDSKTVRLNDEAQEFLWVNPQKALDLDLNRPTRNLIEIYLQGVKA